MIVYLQFLVDNLVSRVREVRSEERRDLGASALEWAIIAAIAVVIATVIGAVVYNVVQKKGSDLNNCSQQAVGTACK